MTRILGGFARLLSKHPIATLIFSIIITIIAIKSASNLEIKSSLVELLPQDTEHVQNLAEATRRSGGDGYLMVAVEGNELDEMTRFANDLYLKIKDIPLIRFIYHKNDLKFIKKHALLFLSANDLNKVEQYLRNKIESESAKLNPFYVDLLADLEPPAADDSTLNQVSKALDKYAILRREYLVNKDNDFLVILIKPKTISSDIKATKRLVTSVQQAIDELAPATYGSGLDVQLNGRYMTQLRDNQAISKDLRSTALISAILIFISLSVLFKKRRTFFVIGIPLLMGVSWTFGVTYLIIGELNLITTFLVAILLGLGINFGIHFFKRYLEFRETLSPEEAVYSMYTSSAGISSITASLTTAAAFFSLIFTQFKGFNQFGIIAGTGAILTLLAYFLLFPSLIILYERFYPLKDTRTHIFPRLRFAEKLMHHAKGLSFTFYGLVFLTIILIFSATRIKFEYDFNKLGTATTEHQRLKTRINNLFNVSLAPTVVIVDSPEESKATVEAVTQFIRKGAKTIVTVQDINSLVPKNQPEKIAIIQQIKELVQTSKIFSFLQGKEKEIFEEFREYLEVEPLTLDMLPSYLTYNFRGQTNDADRFVLVYPGVDLGNGKEVMAYARELNQIQVNGKKIRACSESLILADILNLISRDGTIAVGITILALIILLWLHFKRFKIVGLVMLPILLGTVGLLGIMGILEIRSNFINIVAFPIILGIGIDNSVHFYHRYKEDRSLWFAFYHTGMAMFLTTLTTVIGFGSLFFAQHRGLQSLGTVAVLGLGLNLLATFTILPILIKINNEHSFRILRFSWNHKPVPASQLNDSQNLNSPSNSKTLLENAPSLIPVNNESVSN